MNELWLVFEYFSNIIEITISPRTVLKQIRFFY